MTLAWAIIIVAILFLLDKYHLLKKSLIAAALVALALLVIVMGYFGWHYLDTRWAEHENKVHLAKEDALFAQKNECLNLYTGKVHPVNEPGSQTETTPQPQFQPGQTVVNHGEWTSTLPGGLTQSADEHWCNSNEIIHERGTPIDQWAIMGEIPTVPPGEYHVINGERDSDSTESRTAARLCVSSTGIQRCYTFTEKDHVFGQDAKAEEVKLSSGGKVLLFTAKDYAGNSSWSTVSLLANRGGQLVNLLPDIDETVEYRLWDLPDISQVPVFVNVYSLVWDDSDPNECRACPHRGRIATYVYRKEMGQYVKYDEFMTAKKYDWSSSDSGLDLERAAIISSLKRTVAAEAARHVVVK